MTTLAQDYAGSVSFLSKRKKRSPAPEKKPEKMAGGWMRSISRYGQSVEGKLLSPPSRRRWVTIGLLLAILVLGACIRMASLPQWLERPERTFFKGEPLLTNYDGYYFLNLARELVENRYDPIDTYRAVPDSRSRPSPPPLLSVMAAGLARWKSDSLHWIACLLPALLGPLLALPLFGLGRLYGGTVMGLTAAFMSVLSVGYLGRTHFGWFDTDCLNVTFAVAMIYFFVRFAREPHFRRYLYLAGGLASYGLFQLWWWGAPQVVAGFAAAPLAAAFLLGRGVDGRRHWVICAAALTVFILLTYWQIPQSPWEILQRTWQNYGAENTAGGAFPRISDSIAELKRIPLKKIVSHTTGTWTMFVISTAGLLWLFARHPRDLLFFLALFVVAGLSFVNAGRLIIFLVPALCLGAGFICAQAWAMKRVAWPLTFLVPLLVLGMGYMPYYYGRSARYLPNLPTSFVSALDQISREAPPDTVVWAWWDHGYPVRYWSQRATVCDGGIHEGERVVYVGIPLATDNPRLAANFIQFYVARGIKGIQAFYRALGDDPATGFKLIKEVLAAGPEKGAAILSTRLPEQAARQQSTAEWLEFFFPPDPRPVLLLLEGKLTRTAYWWYWFGTWDPSSRKGVHARFKELPGLVMQNGRLVSRSGVQIDIQNGKARLDPRRPGAVELWEVTLIDGDKVDTNIFAHPKGPVFQYMRQAKLGSVLDRSIAASAFNRLFARHQQAPPYLTVWGTPKRTVRLFRVQGDRLKAPLPANGVSGPPDQNQGVPEAGKPARIPQ